jgi:alpha-beta hydrolase superfamily lysophospholipase
MESNNNKISYETLWKFIIRPPRDEYEEELLGNFVFTYRDKQYQRKDYDLISSEGYIMKCSFIEPIDKYRPTFEMPVVLYLHGNSSSRLEGLNNLEVLLKYNINLFVIDFPGCGLSEGEYISLGYHEKNDVKIIVDFIENLPGISKIGIWGRSMGAATTLLYAYKDPRIFAICIDSPFENFKRLAEELVIKQIKLPKFIIDGALKIVQGTIKKKNGLDIYKLKPLENVSNTFQPALFIHAINDELINVEHSINLFNNYGGPKSLKCCDKGGHNSRRPKIIKKEIGDFFYKYLYTYDHESEQKESNIVHNYKIINSIENEVNSIDNYEDNQDIEYEYENYINEDEDLNNIYEEDYIVNQIIQSQNGGKIEKKENNIGLNENEKMNKERIQKKIKEKKLQFEQMKEAFMNLNINNHNKDDDENNINNENDNDENNFNNINNNCDNDEEEYKNNSNSPKIMENGGKFGL